jgi:hypothetical protein
MTSSITGLIFVFVDAACRRKLTLLVFGLSLLTVIVADSDQRDTAWLSAATCYVWEFLSFDPLRWLKLKITPNAIPSATPIATLCAMFPDDAPYAAPIATPIAKPTPMLFPLLEKQLFGLLFVISSTSLILVPSNSGVALLRVRVPR